MNTCVKCGTVREHANVCGGIAVHRASFHFPGVTDQVMRVEVQCGCCVVARDEINKSGMW